MDINKYRCIITFMIVHPCHVYECRLPHWTHYTPSTWNVELLRSDFSIAAASNSQLNSIIHFNYSSLVRKAMLQKPRIRLTAFDSKLLETKSCEYEWLILLSERGRYYLRCFKFSGLILKCEAKKHEVNKGTFSLLQKWWHHW